MSLLWFTSSHTSHTLFYVDTHIPGSLTGSGNMAVYTPWAIFPQLGLPRRVLFNFEGNDSEKGPDGFTGGGMPQPLAYGSPVPEKCPRSVREVPDKCLRSA